MPDIAYLHARRSVAYEGDGVSWGFRLMQSLSEQSDCTVYGRRTDSQPTENFTSPQVKRRIRLA